MPPIVRAAFVAACSFCASAQWVASGYLGASHTQDSVLTVTQPGLMTVVRFGDIAFAGNSFSSPVYYGYSIAHFWRDRFGIEGELIHLKVYGQMQRATAVQGMLRGIPVSGQIAAAAIVSQFDITHGVNPVLANFVFRQGFGPDGRRDRRRGYLSTRAGAGITIPHHENTILGVHSEFYQVGRPAVQVGAGGGLRLWRGLYAAGQYKFTWTPQRVDVADGMATAALRSHHVVFGFAWHF